MDIRCKHRKHFELADGIISVRCRSEFCGHAAGILIIHRWTLDGVRLPDKRFADPVAARQQKGVRL